MIDRLLDHECLCFLPDRGRNKSFNIIRLFGDTNIFRSKSEC